MSQTLNGTKSKVSARVAFVEKIQKNERLTTNADLTDSTIDSNESFEYESSKTIKSEDSYSNFASNNKFDPLQHSIKNSVESDEFTSYETENGDAGDGRHFASSKNSPYANILNKYSNSDGIVRNIYSNVVTVRNIVFRSNAIDQLTFNVIFGKIISFL